MDTSHKKILWFSIAFVDIVTKELNSLNCKGGEDVSFIQPKEILGTLGVLRGSTLDT